MNRRPVLCASLVLAVAALWFLAAPPSLGGATTLLTTTGSSMAPTISAGDLVVVRRQSSYAVGDVVAYDSPTLRHRVLHRIVAVDARGFTTQGDANTWTDSDLPTSKELLGSLVWHVPGMGHVLMVLQSAVTRMLLLAVLIASVVVLVRRRPAEPVEVQVTPAHDAAQRPALAHIPRQRHNTVTGVAVGMAVALSGLACLAGYTRPGTVESAGIPYNITGTFGYAGSADSDELVYRDGQVGPGDTVYLELVRELTVRFSAELLGPGHYEGGGTIALAVDIIGSSGWRHPLPGAAPTPFTGTRAGVDAHIDLTQLRRTVAAVQQATKVRDPSYIVTLRPDVRFDGRLAESALSKTFTPVFELNGDELALRPDAAGRTGSLTRTEGDVAAAGAPRPAALQLMGASLPVADLRTYGPGGLAVSCLLATTWWRRRAGVRTDVLDEVLQTRAGIPAPRQQSAADARAAAGS